jgi:hypothetical protein
MKKLLVITLAVMVFGCATTKTVVEEVEVPVLYWEPMDNIQKLPPPYDLTIHQMPPEEAADFPREAYRKIAADIAMLLAENEKIRYMYNKLVERVQTKPEEVP